MIESYDAPPWAMDGAVLVQVLIYRDGPERFRWRKPWVRSREKRPIHLCLVPAGATVYEQMFDHGRGVVLSDDRVLAGYRLMQHVMEEPGISGIA